MRIKVTGENIIKKFTVFFIGLFIVILLLEVGLRIIGIVHLKKVAFNKKSLSTRGRYIILCLGDSWTLGYGVPDGKDYPTQLEKLLNLKAKDKFFRVINNGRVGQNTTQLLKELQFRINKLKPDLVIILIGGANAWNYEGYYTYLKGENFLSKLHNQLYRIRVYKLIRHLSFIIKDKIKIHLPYRDRDKHENAIKQLKEAMKLDPANGDNYHRIGIIYKDQGKFEEAIKWFKEGIKAVPTNSNNYYGMGLVYKDRRNPREAIKWLKEAIKLNPTNSNIYLDMAWIYGEVQRSEEAIKCLKEAIKFNPTDSDLYSNIGWFYKRLGEYEEATKYLEEAIRLNPVDSNNYHRIGIIYKDQGKFEEAIKWFKEGIKIGPTQSNNYYELGLVYRDQKKFEEAIKWFKEAIKLNPNISDYRGIVKSYVELGKFDEAAKFFWGLARIKPLTISYIKMLEKKEEIGKEIQLWVEADINEIIELCKKKKIKIILQNYPRKREIEISKDIAEKQSIPFVDNLQIFNELWEKGEKRDNYFILEGHCSEKGYELMAKNIYDKIIKGKLFDLKDGD